MSPHKMQPTLILLSLVLLAAPSALGYSITLNSGNPTFTAIGTGVNPANGALSASAQFTMSALNNGTLTIVLTNTGPAARVPSDVLTGLFFNASQHLPSTPTSNATAKLTSGSNVVKEGSTVSVPGNDVGSEFAYRWGLGSGSPATQGISSSGLGAPGSEMFGPGNRFDTSSNLAGPASPDGLQYGIVSAVASNANSKVKEEPLIKNSVTFTFKNLGFTELTLTKFVFQYGTSLSEPQLFCTNCDLRTPPPVPEPSFYGLLSAGLGGLFWIARRRKAA